jgi:hypothetical protein
MKKKVLFTMAAVLGLAGLSVISVLGQDNGNVNVVGQNVMGNVNGQAQSRPVLPPGFTSVNVDFVLLEQNTNSDVETNSMEFHFKNVQIDNQGILDLVNNEFGTSFSGTNGDRLVVSNFWDGRFLVLDTNGNVALANASSRSGSRYKLYFYSTNTVYAGQLTTNNGTISSITDGYLIYESGDGSNFFHLEGLTMVNDTYSSNSTNNTESFALSAGIGSATLPVNGETGVLTGSIGGSGTGNVPAP